MGINSWLLLGSLRGAVKKLSFLMNFNINHWRIASTIAASSSNHRRLSHSFNDRPGFRACTDDLNTYYDSPGSSRGGRGISRTSSCLSEDDIHKRAEMFIANFYQQLQIERQVSLELRYCRANSLESASP
ncbi:hypothetical protein ACSBR1_001605 [Camellia fascicularis]